MSLPTPHFDVLLTRQRQGMTYRLLTTASTGPSDVIQATPVLEAPFWFTQG